jgi:hypothetical protein
LTREGLFEKSPSRRAYHKEDYQHGSQGRGRTEIVRPFPASGTVLSVSVLFSGGFQRSGFRIRFGFAYPGYVADVPEINVDLLRRGMAVSHFALVDDDLADKGTKDLRRKRVDAGVSLRRIKEPL